MSEEVENYLSHRYWPEDELLSSLRRDVEYNTDPMMISPETGKLLALLVKACGATRVLEVGTLFGYSAICMARAMPAHGKLDTVEKSAYHADAAQRWFKEAGVSKMVRIHHGYSNAILPKLEGPYDLIFLDAEKGNYVNEAEHALRLLRPGGLLVADNMVWHGKVADRKVHDEATEGVRALHAFIANHDDFMSTVLPIGDGLSVSVKAA